MQRFLSLLLLLFCTTISAQVKYGKVTKEELKKEHSSIEAEAPAEVISKTGSYDIDFLLSKERFEATKKVTVRIKIYDKDKAPEYLMKVAIPAYKNDSDKEKIYDIKASTYNLVDGKIVRSKVDKNDIYTEEASKYLNLEKFAFPNVSDGSILEYKYTNITPSFFDLGTWYFQEEVPVVYNSLRISYPEFFIFQKDRRGDISNRIITKKNYGQSNSKNIVDKLVYENVVALKDEPFVQNLNNIRTSIRYELSEYNNHGYGYKNFSTTWERIAKDLEFSSYYGGELNGNSFLDDDVQQFDALSTKEEKLENIFDFVQRFYTWNGYLSLYPDNGTRKTFKQKKGNGTDINFILISMLRKAGINANPVVLSTVENGMLNYFPSKHKLNHTITGVLIGNDLYLMDPTAPFSKINLLPQRDLNFSGFMFQEGGEIQKVSLVNRIISTNEKSIDYELNDDLIQGKMTHTKTNYFAIRDLTKKQVNASEFEENYRANIDAEISDFSFKENNRGDAVRYQLNFEEGNYVESIGNKLLIKPLLFNVTERNEFKFSNIERKYPLEFGTPFSSVTTAKFKIPEGYEIESMPETVHVLLKDNVGGYNISFEKVSDEIVIQKVLHIGQSILPQHYYADVKEMFQKIIEVENKQIILRKL